MTDFVNWIDSLAGFSPYLPWLARFFIWTLIALLIFIPFSALCWLIIKSFGDTLELFTNRLERFAAEISLTSKKLFARANRTFRSLYANNSTVVSFDSATATFSGHPIQEAIDGLEREIKNAPAFAADAEAEKSNIILSLNGHLDQLFSGMSSLGAIKIPKLDLDKTVEIAKRNALSSLWVFSILLIAVIVTNTVLLNTFFDDLFEGQEVLGVPYAVSVALMFTFIEAGSGVVIGYLDCGKGVENNQSHMTVKVFAWFIIICLALVEFALYLLVGAGFSDTGIPGLIENLENRDWFSIIFVGFGWLAALGPGIVAGLYVFGHMASSAYFTFIQQTDLQRFKKDLDDNFNLFEKISELADEISEKVKEVISNIRNENIRLGNNASVDGDVLTNLSKMIDEKITALNGTLNELEMSKVPSPEVQIQKLGPEETASFLRLNFIYLAILCVSFIIYSLVIPTTFQIGTTSIQWWGIEYFIAFLIIGLGVLSGHIVMSGVRIVNLSDGVIARLVLERKGPFIYVIACLLVIVLIGATYIICSPYQSGGSFINFSLSILALVGAFFVGRIILSAFSIWVVGFYYLISLMKACISLLFKWFVILFKLLLELIFRILYSFGTPMRWLINETP
jgi:hypothetical protein